jgi:regulator of protease activity HflC (stomatin/prohibitin superfamily)
MSIPLLTEWIVNNALALIPVQKIHSFQRGVKYSFGRDVAELGTGIHLYMPFFQSIEVVDVKQQTHNLLTQTMTTKCGKTITFSCNLTYSITSARNNFTKVHDFLDSLQNYAMMVAADNVAKHPFKELLNDREYIQETIRQEIHTRAKKWGAAIDDFAFTDLVEAKPYRLFGDPLKL